MVHEGDRAIGPHSVLAALKGRSRSAEAAASEAQASIGTA
jgi:hypothetical protein